MKSKLLMVLTAACLLGADAKDGPVPEVDKALRALNEAFAKRDADAIGRLIAADHVAVTPYYGGPMSRADQLKTLPDLQLSEYTMGDAKTTQLSKDVVLITYPLTMKGTFKGKEVARKSYATALWVNQGGKWLEAFYQETALDGK